MLATVKELLGQLAESKKIESDPDEKRAAYDPREKVLVTVAWDGWTEIYAESWVDVKVVECWPWEDECDLILPETYNRLYLPVKLRGTALAKMRRLPSLSEVLMRYAEHEERMEAIERFKNLVEQRTNGDAKP